MFLRSSGVVSGLQQLLSNASASLSPHTPRGQRQLESVTEEAHTYDLLYPEEEALQQAQFNAYPLRHGDPALVAAAANSSDDRGGLDIQSPRDIRIIIAQDANRLSSQPRVLYDSHPPPSFPQARANQTSHRRADSAAGGEVRYSINMQKSHTAPHSRQSSLSQNGHILATSPPSPLSPVNELGGLFGKSNVRNSTARPTSSGEESVQNKIAREGREETDALLECMFGAAGFQHVLSTKLHVRPPRVLGDENENRPKTAKEPTSPGSFTKRGTPLTRSTTAADLSSLALMSGCQDSYQRAQRLNSSSILITRLFSVNVVYSDNIQGSKEPRLAGDIEQDTAGLSRTEGPSVENAINGEKADQLKIPTYAVAILLHMPQHRSRPLIPSFPRNPGYSAINTQSWPTEGSPSSNNFGSECNRDIDYVISHFDILSRALSSLESMADSEIGSALAKLEYPNLQNTILESSKPSLSLSAAALKKAKQPIQWTLQLAAGALQQSPTVRNLSDATSKRIALALKIRRVVAGQGRWPVWREEARWVGKWAGGREQNFFLFNLLTAFLGSHTVWLDSLGPSRYRHRQHKHSHGVHGDASLIQQRTVIVSQDKMAARRLVFLLSAFLPGSYFNVISDGQPQHDASWSNMGYSQSPPSGMPGHRQHLRRTINRRTQGSHTKYHAKSHGRSISFSGPDFVPNEDAINEAHIVVPRSRRPSDARSIRGAALPISFNDPATRKSSTTTTATVMPEPTIPIPHFSAHSTERPVSIVQGSRPESSGSLVSLSLKRSLSRSESNEQSNVSNESQSASRWGSLVSGLWSNRRGSSTQDSELLASSEEGLGIVGLPKNSQNQQGIKTLSQMVKEVSTDDEPQHQTQESTLVVGGARIQAGRRRGSQDVDEAFSPKDSNAVEQFPLKLSVDEHDGVVDVELPPTNSYSSSFASTLSSPIAIHTATSSFNDRAPFHGRTSSHSVQATSPEGSIDVAGWLRSYHQDFTLQAVRPYDSLKADIKLSMRTEPHPAANITASTENAAADNWTEVCTTLIADTTTFTVTRLSLRRKNAKSPHHQANALLKTPTQDHSSDEEFTEEPLMDIDPTFIDAVEKVLAQSGQSSRAASRTTSRAPSPSRQYHNIPRVESEHNAGLEVPRSECKRMVLGALEQVARSVSAELANGRDVKSDTKENGMGRARGRDVPADSTLREGVRKWLSEVGREGT